MNGLMTVDVAMQFSLKGSRWIKEPFHTMEIYSCVKGIQLALATPRINVSQYICILNWYCICIFYLFI